MVFCNTWYYFFKKIMTGVVSVRWKFSRTQWEVLVNTGSDFSSCSREEKVVGILLC